MATNFVAQRQVLAKIKPIGGDVAGYTRAEYFAQVSGGEVTASVEKIYVGGETHPKVLCAPAETGDITLTAHYSREDVDALNSWRAGVGKTYYQVDIYDMDCGLAVKQSQRMYASCLLVGLTEPDGDSSSGAPATFTLTFAVSGGTAVRGTTAA